MSWRQSQSQSQSFSQTEVGAASASDPGTSEAVSGEGSKLNIRETNVGLAGSVARDVGIRSCVAEVEAGAAGSELEAPLMGGKLTLTPA